MPHFYTRCISLPFDSYFDLFYAPQLLLFGSFRVVSVAEVNKAAALVVQASADILNEKAAADQCLPGERKERGKRRIFSPFEKDYKSTKTNVKPSVSTVFCKLRFLLTNWIDF